MADRIGEFSRGVKNRVRTEQQNRCDYCGNFCDGKHVRMEVHHVEPLGLHPEKRTEDEVAAIRRRDNAVGLCTPCHKRFDRLARRGVSYNEQVMKEAYEQERWQQRQTRRERGMAGQGRV